MTKGTNSFRMHRCNTGILTCLVIGTMVNSAGLAQAADVRKPAHDAYVKKASWSETMLASRKALRQRKEATKYRPFISKVMRGEQPAEYISVNVCEVEELRLCVTNGRDGWGNDRAVWGEAKLIAKDGTETYLSDIDPVFVKIWHGKFRRNRDFLNRPLRIGDKRLKNGLWVLAYNEIYYRLDKKYERF